MKFAVSNIALPSYDHAAELSRLPEFGLTGLEVALSRVWEDVWHGLSASDVTGYRHAVEAAGLEVVGLHSLFWQVPELGLFADSKARGETLDFLVHLSQVCADLGGRTLIFGSGPARRRGDRSLTEANKRAIGFFAELSRRVESHGTCFCLEPLGPNEADYVNSLADALVLVDAVDHPAFRAHLDAKALTQAGEVTATALRAAAPVAAHFHANQPDLGVLEKDGDIDHAALGRLLAAIGYGGFVSIEQRMVSADDPLADIAASAAVLADCYAI